MIAPRTVAIQDILFATDLSPHSDHAFQAALALAEHFGAKLHLIHVVAFPSQKNAGVAGLKSFAESNVGEGTEFTTTVAVGAAATEIVNYAKREKVDLIVIGTHGRTGLAHVLMGSVAEAVVRSAPCEVLTIKFPKEAKAVARQPAEVKPKVSPPQIRCLVCAQPSQETVCDACKAKIRGEALDKKTQAEKPGKKGLSV